MASPSCARRLICAATIKVERHNSRLMSSARSGARQGVIRVLGWRSHMPKADNHPIRGANAATVSNAPRNKSNAFDTATSHRLLIVQASDAAAREGARLQGPRQATTVMSAA